ncbi:MAG: 50S ribosomal protein L17 [Bacteroidetes bacterium]|nr:50S ribosomal protein L17 [Bacteroidota bacterium]
MRHGKKNNHLSRTASHRSALLANMASSLILHKKIATTVAKAKELRKYIEPLITKAKTDSTHSRRTVFSYLKYKDPVIALFGEVAPKVGDRPGGYTRILKTGVRLGDNSDMCIIELVDFNEIYTTSKKAATTKTRRSRKGTGATTTTTAKKVETAPAATTTDEVVDTTAEEVTDTTETTPTEE